MAKSWPTCERDSCSSTRMAKKQDRNARHSRAPAWDAEVRPLILSLSGSPDEFAGFGFPPPVAPRCDDPPKSSLAPLPLPGEHRLCDRRNRRLRQTTLYTIDEFCVSPEACPTESEESRPFPIRSIGSIPSQRELIFFTEREFGNLYALNTRRQQRDKTTRQRIILSSAGSPPGTRPIRRWFIIDLDNNLYLLDIVSDFSPGSSQPPSPT